MTYKKRLIILSSLIAAMSLLYAGSLIFTSDFGNARSSAYVWLDSKAAERLDRITISTAVNNFELVKQNNRWFVQQNDNLFPARNLRVNDLLNILTTRTSWPVRSTSVSSFERFGLEENASRITAYADNLIMLDLFIGDDDAAGNDAFFRRLGVNEVRSGSSGIKTYLSGAVNTWYNMRLIPESEGNQLEADSVQRLTVNTPEDQQVFSRRNRTWTISGIDVENPSQPAIETYIRGIINAEGNEFSDAISVDAPLLDHSSIVIEFGTGRVVTIRFSEGDEENGRRFANVTGIGSINSDYVYSIPVWTSSRLFRDAQHFERQ
jgi:hypothetical protein